jgi:hypothetical protein
MALKNDFNTMLFDIFLRQILSKNVFLDKVCGRKSLKNIPINVYFYYLQTNLPFSQHFNYYKILLYGVPWRLSFSSFQFRPCRYSALAVTPPLPLLRTQ